MSDPKGIRSAPSRAVRPPHDRHYITMISGRTTASERTTLILPGVDVAGDLAAIRNGESVRDGEYYTVHGRTWFHELNGRVFPVSGAGFVGPVGRGVIYALQALGRYNGVNEQSEREIALHPAISPDDAEEAASIWRLRERER